MKSVKMMMIVAFAALLTGTLAMAQAGGDKPAAPKGEGKHGGGAPGAMLDNLLPAPSRRVEAYGGTEDQVRRPSSGVQERRRQMEERAPGLRKSNASRTPGWRQGSCTRFDGATQAVDGSAQGEHR
jgi:hypothetical protein